LSLHEKEKSGREEVNDTMSLVSYLKVAGFLERSPKQMTFKKMDYFQKVIQYKILDDVMDRQNGYFAMYRSQKYSGQFPIEVLH
jgi:hypothetical protein